MRPEKRRLELSASKKKKKKELKRGGFCLVEWFMEKKMLSVAGGGYLFIYFIYI